MKFLDQAKIFIKSGDGGPGCVSFHRAKYLEYGGPDGGNGGDGGNVIFECVDGLNTLIDFRYNQHFKASRGEHGKGRNKTGANGADVVVRVPVGTEILDDEKERVLYDFTRKGERIVFLKGGDGGFGNAHYKSSTNQAPRKFTPGWPGQEMDVWLRLKLIADAGLVGLPNAGKSTFLAACSSAKPKIGDYPFTTISPNLGVVKAGDFDFVLADIPGLIEGAHEGRGLGDRFLGHIERTSVLLHLIDITQDDVLGAYKTIRNELAEYGHDVEDKQEIVALNKIDALPAEDVDFIAEELEKLVGKPVEKLSAVSGQGVDEILFKLAACIREEKQRVEDETRGPEDFDPVEE